MSPMTNSTANTVREMNRSFKGDFDWMRVGCTAMLLMPVFMNMRTSADVPSTSSLNPYDDNFSWLKAVSPAVVTCYVFAFIYGEYTGNNWFRKKYQSRDITIEDPSTTTKAYANSQGDITVNTDTLVEAFTPQDQGPIYDFTPSLQTTRLTIPEATYLHRLQTYLKSISKKICCDFKSANYGIKKPLITINEKEQAFKGDLELSKFNIPVQLIPVIFVSMTTSFEIPSVASFIDPKDDHFSAFKLTCLLTFLGCITFAGYGECTGNNWLRKQSREINILIQNTNEELSNIKGFLDRDGNVIIKTTTLVQPILDETQPPQYGFNPNSETTKPIITQTWCGWFKEKLCGNSENPISNIRQSTTV